jgi:BirA family biotin operon repressor/biotin-[acetyl-CoA-carboxylase] ligase
MFKMDHTIISFKVLNSTNDYLIFLHKKFNIQKNLVIVADSQKKGRGRRERLWFSDRDSLTFSFSLQIHQDINSLKISMATSLSLIKLLGSNNVKAMIKYPNDILVKNQKIAGILTEVISINDKKYCIVGVGLNVNNKVFPDNLPYALSMMQVLSKSVDKKLLLHSFLSHLDLLLVSDSVKKDYLNQLYGVNKFISCLYKGSFVRVKILSIDSNGFLKIITKNSQIRTVKHQDIKWIID